MRSWMFAARAAAISSSSVASGLPYVEVAPHRIVEQVGLLRNHTDRLTERLERDLPDVRIVDLDRAFLDVVEPRHEVGHVVLPAPDGPTRAASCPGLMSRSTPSSVHSLGTGRRHNRRGVGRDRDASRPRGGSSYRKRTSRSRTRPFTSCIRTASGASGISCGRSRYSKIRSKSASDDCTSVETCSIEPIGKNSRDCRVVNPTSIPDAITSDPEFELTQPATRYTRAARSRRTCPRARRRTGRSSSGGAGSL